MLLVCFTFKKLQNYFQWYFLIQYLQEFVFAIEREKSFVVIGKMRKEWQAVGNGALICPR